MYIVIFTIIPTQKNTFICRVLVKIIFMKSINEKFLRDKENEIKLLISRRDNQCINAFNFLHKHYVLKDLTGNKPILSVFESIYVNNVNVSAWKLAGDCNLSRSTVFNYRNIIVNDFNICLSTKFILDESNN